MRNSKRRRNQREITFDIENFDQARLRFMREPGVLYGDILTPMISQASARRVRAILDKMKGRNK